MTEQFKPDDEVIVRCPRMPKTKGVLVRKHTALDAWWVTVGSNKHIQRLVKSKYLKRCEDGKTP